MSGPPGTALNRGSDATEVHTVAVAEKVGCAAESEDAMLQCLKEVPRETLLSSAIEYSVANHPPAACSPSFHQWTTTCFLIGSPLCTDEEIV